MKERNAEEDLAFIRRVMEDSRKIMVDDGLNYILWGIIIVFGLAIIYIKEVSRISLRSDLIWLIFSVIGVFLTLWINRHKHFQSRAKTFAGQILKSLWTAIALSIAIIGLVGYHTDSISIWSFPAVFSIIIGLGYFISALLYNQSWIKFVAVAWWGGGLIMFFWKSIQTIILFSLMMILFQIIPGIALYKKWRKEWPAKTDD